MNNKNFLKAMQRLYFTFSYGYGQRKVQLRGYLQLKL